MKIYVTNIKVILWGINFHSGESRKNILIKKICDNENTNVKDYDFTSFEFLAKQGAIILDDPLTFYKKQENHKMLWKSFYNYLFEKIHIINNNICILNTNNVFNYKTQIDKQTFDFKSNDTINKQNLYLRLSFNEALCFQKKQYEKKQEELNNLDKNSTNYEYRRNLIMDYDDNMTPF